MPVKFASLTKAQQLALISSLIDDFERKNALRVAAIFRIPLTVFGSELIKGAMGYLSETQLLQYINSQMEEFYYLVIELFGGHFKDPARFSSIHKICEKHCFNPGTAIFEDFASAFPNQFRQFKQPSSEIIQELKKFGIPVFRKHDASCMDTLDIKSFKECMEILKKLEFSPSVVSTANTLKYLSSPEVYDAYEQCAKIIFIARANPNGIAISLGKLQSICYQICSVAYKIQTTGVGDVATRAKILFENILSGLAFNKILYFVLPYFNSASLVPRLWGRSAIMHIESQLSQYFESSAVKEFKEIYEKLEKLQQEGISVDYYIDKAMTICFAIFFMLSIYETLYSSGDSEPMSFFAQKFIGPSFFSILVYIIRKLHFLNPFGKSNNDYSHDLESWINRILWKNAEDKNTFAGNYMEKIRITKMDGIPGWGNLQYNIKLDNKALRLMLEEVFERHEIIYNLSFDNKDDAGTITLHASRVYDVLQSLVKISAMRDEVFARVVFFDLTSKDTGLSRMKKSACIQSFQVDVESKLISLIDVDAKLVKKIQDDILESVLIGRELKIKFDRVVKLKKILAEFFTPMQDSRQAVKTQFDAEVSFQQHISEKTIKMRRTQQVVQRDVQAPANVPIEYKWEIGGQWLSSNDWNVNMIAGTERHANPIFVTFNFLENPDPFLGDDRARNKVINQILAPKLAAPRGEQGIFIQHELNIITVKILGRNGLGDLRASGNGFNISMQGNARLYSINRVDRHAHIGA